VAAEGCGSALGRRDCDVVLGGEGRGGPAVVVVVKGNKKAVETMGCVHLMSQCHRAKCLNGAACV
jgi:hypothetical protein